MGCTEFHARWQWLLDHRRSPESDQQLQAHAAVCSECDELLRVQTVLFAAVEQRSDRQRSDRRPAPVAAPPVTVARGVRSRWIPGGWGIGLAMAGALAIFIIPALRRIGDETPVSRVVAQRDVRPVWSLPAGAVWLGKVPPRVNRATASVQPLVTRTNSAADPGALSAADQESLRQLMEEMAARIQDVPPEQFEPLEEITGGLRPVASTLSAAWDALIRTIPMGKPAEEPNPQATWDSAWTANHHA